MTDISGKGKAAGALPKSPMTARIVSSSCQV